MELAQGAINVTNRLWNGYLWTRTLAEPAVQSWPLVNNASSMFMLTVFYLVMVVVGPRMMRDREPLKLRWVLVFYNIGLSMLSFYIAVTTGWMALRLNYSWICEPFPKITRPEDLTMATALWCYYVSKFIEFFDTFFFILRKKEKQLTFLHVYHHGTMPLMCWIGIKWVPGGSPFLGAFMNSIVHVVMYGYYGLSALGPAMQKYLWWKKYLTVMQLLQFTIALVLGIFSLRNEECAFPYWMRVNVVTYMTSYIVLFMNFYIHAYIKSHRAEHKKNDDLRKQRHQQPSVANGFDKSHEQNNSVRSRKVAT